MEHDVVARCPNGKIIGRSGADIYVVFRIDLEQMDADALAYSYDEDFGGKFIEQIACREVYGKFWDFEKMGSPCWDPYGKDGQEMPKPKGKFMMWDEPEETAPDAMPVPKAICLTVYDGERAVRRYKMATIGINVFDLIAMETEGDKFFNS